MATAIRHKCRFEPGAVMKHWHKQILFAIVGALLAAVCAWWWFDNMEKRWTALELTSDAATRNPMLGAERLLTKHRHTVNAISTLEEAERGAIPDGTLILLDNGGRITSEQATTLLAWVQRGNTLIIRPKWTGRTSDFTCGQSDDDDEPPASEHNEEEANTDPIGTEYGVELSELDWEEETSDDAPNTNTKHAKEARRCLTQIAFPAGRHAIQLNIDRFALRSSDYKTEPIFGDDTFDAVRVYARGAGHVVFVAQDYFDNDHLPWYDNAELLVNLAELNRNARHVLIVQHLDMPSWYEALWWNFHFGIVGVGCFLALLFWIAVRRFGPILPEPDEERRSLIEHIDASGRWLWKVPGGRDLLLAAVRTSTEKLLLRRMPELLRMTPAERATTVAQASKMPAAAVASALLDPAAKHPIEFTRQIQTLQQLRKHHER